MPSNPIKKILKNNFFWLFFSVSAVFLFVFQYAQAGLVPCGSGNNPHNACTLCHLIVGIFNIVGWFKNILITVAVVGIFASGIMYIISSGSETAITKAKGFLRASLTGFTIVLMSWFFVNTIMWILSAKGDLGIGKTNWYTFDCSTETSMLTTTPPIIPIPPTIPTGTLTNEEALTKLLNVGIPDPKFSSSGRCNDQTNSTCTSLQGIPERTITNLIKIKETCGLPMTITGGTEVGHKSHGTGKTPVDLSWNASLADCIKKNSSTFNVKEVCTAPQDAEYRINCNYDETNQHIHIAFN